MKYLLLLAAGICLSVLAYTQCGPGYVEPTFQLKRTDPSCVANSGSIEVINLQDGVGPFTYRLIELNITNSTGNFTGLAPGLYSIELRDACGTVRTRQVTLIPYQFSFTFQINKAPGSCKDADYSFVPTPAAAVYQYGVVLAGAPDTIWSNSANFTAGITETLTLVVKDACGNIQTLQWRAPEGFLPYIEDLQHRLLCDKFDLFPVFYGFDAPEVCLYEYGTNRLIECKQAPPGIYTGGFQTNFFNIPWGEYYVIVQDKCARDSAFHPDERSAGGSQIDPYDWDCNKFKMHVDGPAPPASWYAQNPNVPGSPDSICLFRESDSSLVACKYKDDHLNWINPRTGVPWESGAVFDNLPYGSYFAYIFDPCMDSTFYVDSTVRYPFKIETVSYPACDTAEATLRVMLDYGVRVPVTVSIYHPNGVLAKTVVSNQFDTYITFPYYTQGGVLTAIITDSCGFSDTSQFQQYRLELVKNYNIISRCPGLSGNSGSGDLTVDCLFMGSSNYRPFATIVKYNNADTLINYSTYTPGFNHRYTFPNLISGRYVIRYQGNFCGGIERYDTITVADYFYPSQIAPHIVQCGDNPFVFTDSTIYGLAPFTYEMIATQPTIAALLTGPQASNQFLIPAGTNLDSVSIKVVDACGNSNTKTFAVQHIIDCQALEVGDDDKQEQLRNRLIKVYPNPSHENFIISFRQKRKADYQVDVVNALGIVMYSTRLSGIDTKDVLVNKLFSPGLYIINITKLGTGKTEVFKQIIK